MKRPSVRRRRAVLPRVALALVLTMASTGVVAADEAPIPGTWTVRNGESTFLITSEEGPHSSEWRKFRIDNKTSWDLPSGITEALGVLGLDGSYSQVVGTVTDGLIEAKCSVESLFCTNDYNGVTATIFGDWGVDIDLRATDRDGSLQHRAMVTWHTFAVDGVYLISLWAFSKVAEVAVGSVTGGTGIPLAKLATKAALDYFLQLVMELVPLTYRLVAAAQAGDTSQMVDEVATLGKRAYEIAAQDFVQDGLDAGGDVVERVATASGSNILESGARFLGQVASLVTDVGGIALSLGASAQRVAAETIGDEVYVDWTPDPVATPEPTLAPTPEPTPLVYGPMVPLSLTFETEAPPEADERFEAVLRTRLVELGCEGGPSATLDILNAFISWPAPIAYEGACPEGVEAEVVKRTLAIPGPVAIYAVDPPEWIPALAGDSGEPINSIWSPGRGVTGQIALRFYGAEAAAIEEYTSRNVGRSLALTVGSIELQTVIDKPITSGIVKFEGPVDTIRLFHAIAVSGQWRSMGVSD